MAKIQYRVKIKKFQSLKTLEFEDGFKPKQSLSRADFVGDNKHRFYNSTWFAGILERAQDEILGTKYVVFLSDLPNGVTVSDTGFLRTVTIDISKSRSLA